MEINLRILKVVWPNAEFINFDGNEVFSYLNITKINSVDISVENQLFFAIYDDKPEIEGWVVEKMDRRRYFPEIAFEKKTWAFVIERDVHKDVNEAAKTIVVENIYHATLQLFKYVLSVVHPKVCGVTGSAGKTTTVALLEEVILNKYQCLRIYSKRITPYILFSQVINLMKNDTEIIVLEYAMYRLDHILKLVKLLPPDISVILNVLRMHIGVNTVSSIEQILESKSKIITEESKNVLNASNNYVRKLLKENKNLTTVAIKPPADVFLKYRSKGSIVISCFNNDVEVKPYILTELSVLQIMVAFAIASLLDIDLSKVQVTVNEFVPKENRIPKIKYKSHTVYFDATVTHSAYLNELAKNFYDDTTLIIYHIDFSEENPIHIIPDLIKIFKNFSRVKILNKIENMQYFENSLLPKNTEFASLETLMDSIPMDSIIFLHYSKYFRIHEVGFDGSELLNATLK